MEKEFNFLRWNEIWCYESARIVYQNVQNVSTTAVTVEGQNFQPVEMGYFIRTLKGLSGIHQFVPRVVPLDRPMKEIPVFVFF